MKISHFKVLISRGSFESKHNLLESLKTVANRYCPCPNSVSEPSNRLWDCFEAVIDIICSMICEEYVSSKGSYAELLTSLILYPQDQSTPGGKETCNV